MHTIKELRRRKPATFLEVAAATSMDVTTVKRIEWGVTLPRPSTMRKLAKYFGVPPWEIQFGKDVEEA